TAPFTYSWDLGDGATSTQQSVTHSYGVGSYTATVTITDNAGKTSVAATHVTVYPALTVTSQVTPTQGTSPLGVAFSAQASGGLAPFHYSWNFGDGTSGAGPSLTHTYGSGTFDATLTVTDAAGGSAVSHVGLITAAAPPVNSSGSSGGGGNSNPPPSTSTTPPASPTVGPTSEPTTPPSDTIPA